MRIKRKPKQKMKEEYKLAKNEYVRIREEEKIYKKDIVDKCKEEPKLFHRFINGILKCKERIARLQENKEVYEGPKEISEEQNKIFRKYLQQNPNLKNHKDKREKMRYGK